ncbi:MAG: polyprenyl synthetase family protein, partial [Thermodesulfobacteriota bacterium]
FGLQLGIAFQLLDDIQDYLSNQTHTGKEPGRDLAEGKVTLPVLVAFRQAGTKDKKRIRHIISAPQREKHLGELTTLLEDHGGFSYTLREAERCVRKAVSALHIVPACEERADIERAAWKMLRENTPRKYMDASDA